MNSQPPVKKKAVSTGVSSGDVVSDDKKSGGSLGQFVNNTSANCASWNSREQQACDHQFQLSSVRYPSVEINQHFVLRISV